MFGTVSPSARRTAAAGAVLAAALAAAACSGSGTTSSPSGSASGSTPPASSSPSASPTGSITGTVTPGPKNDLAKRKNVQLKGCTVSKTGGEASGVITNKGAKAVVYTITVVFTNDKASNVGAETRKVIAAAGKDTTW
ncbi:MAG TPA: hypothetical protein VHM65_04290, partial [Candidatus Lustribacter sp.]|nr:hypothetical protein [Candidatus Lustribacter sp.]